MKVVVVALSLMHAKARIQGTGWSYAATDKRLFGVSPENTVILTLDGWQKRADNDEIKERIQVFEAMGGTVLTVS